MAYAYQPFANNGQYSPPVSYERVTDIDGNIILEKFPSFYQAYKPESAAIMADLLKEPLKSVYNAFPSRGTAAGRTIKNSAGKEIATAGKTGTTENNRDVWFVGFTPYYVGAVWYGYDGRLKTINIPLGDSANALNIWANVMNKIHSSLEPADFYYPPSLVEMEICIISGKLATQACEEAGKYVYKDYFLPGAAINPSEVCDIHLMPTPSPTPSPTPVPTVTPVPSPTPLPTEEPTPVESTPLEPTPAEPTISEPQPSVTPDSSQSP